MLPNYSNQKKEEPTALPPNEKELLKWAIEHSEDAKNIRNDHLMSHEEFKEMWNDLCPDTVEQLKANLATIRSNPKDDEMYLALDKTLFIVEDIDAADWFVDLKGYDAVVPLLDNPNTEIRMAAAWIISNTLQNNPKDQKKFFEQVGLEIPIKSLESETVEKPAIRKLSLISNAIRGFKPLREQFYKLNGLNIIMNSCQKFKPFYFRFCWLIGAVLDDEDKSDLVVMKEAKVKEFLTEHKADIDDDEIFTNVVSRLN